MRLPRLLGGERSARVCRKIQDKVLPKSEATGLKQEAGFRKPYMDPVLRDPRRCASLTLRLYRRGVIYLASSRSETVEQVGLLRPG